jgi:hypothetical protein
LVLKRLKTRKINRYPLFLVSFLVILLLISIIPLNISSVQADSVNSGFNFFTNYTDISIGVAGSWEDVDVSSYVPSGATGVILEFTNEGAGIEGYDVRHPASASDDYGNLHLYSGNHAYAYVGINSTFYFEMYIGSTDIDCWIIGYTDQYVTFFDDYIDYALGTALAWTDIDLSAYVPVGATGVIMKIVNPVANYEVGVRHPASTDNFHLDSRQFSFQMCGVNSSRMIEGYVENLGADHKLVAYTTEPITFNVNWVDISIVPVGAWTDIDVTAQTIAGATGVIVYDHLTTVNWRESDIRENGSTNDQYADSQNYVGGANFMGCGLGTGEILEGQISNIDVDFYLVAWTEEVVTTIVYPTAIHSSSGVTNATHSMANNNTWALFLNNGWCIYDFGSAIINVTAIIWELGGGDQGVYRIEASNDLISWDTLVQPRRTFSGAVPPPSDTNGSSRYDSEVHGRYRYFRLREMYPNFNSFSVDYIALAIQPPAISYSDGSYYYPMELEYWDWNYIGNWFGDEHYCTSPHNLLGANQSDTGDTGSNRSVYTLIVNSDWDEDNYIVAKMDDFYNVTMVEVFGSFGTHGYLWVSEYADSEFELVDDWTDSDWAWYGHAITKSYVRYIKLNCTGVGTNTIDIESIRLTGVVAGGSPPASGGGEFYFPPFMDLPTALATLLGMTVFSAGILLSGIFLLMFLLPVVWYGRNSLAVMMVGLTLIGFLVTIAWLPVWIILIIILLIAGMYASKIADWLGSTKKD